MAKYKKGHKGIKTLRKPGDKRGRPPEWFKQRCARLASNITSLKFMEDCINGEEVDVKVTKFGDVVPIRAGAAVRVDAWSKVADRGYGKPHQSVDLSGDVNITSGQLAEIIHKERVARGLEKE